MYLSINACTYSCQNRVIKLQILYVHISTIAWHLRQLSIFPIMKNYAKTQQLSKICTPLPVLVTDSTCMRRSLSCLCLLSMAMFRDSWSSILSSVSWLMASSGVVFPSLRLRRAASILSLASLSCLCLSSSVTSCCLKSTTTHEIISLIIGLSTFILISNIKLFCFVKKKKYICQIQLL